MKLTEIREWARSIDVEKVDPKKRHHAQCYKEMIEDKIARIMKATVQIQDWQDNLQEYLSQLERVGVAFNPEPEPILPPDEPEPEPEPEPKGKKKAAVLPE